MTNFKNKANRVGPAALGWAGGGFVGAAWKGRLLSSADGVTWKDAHKADRHVLAVAAGTV